MELIEGKRIKLKKVFSLLLTLVVLLTMFSSFGIEAQAMFNDVYVGHWAYEAIRFATQSKLLNGYSDGTFLPNKSISRAEAMKVLILFMNRSQRPGETSFSDVSPKDWFAPYVEAGLDLYPSLDIGGEFRPNDPMAREDAVFALVRTSKLASSIQYVDMSLVDEFTDYDRISAEVAPYMAVAVQSSLISGYSDGTIRPRNSLTRAEFVAMLYRAYKLRDGEEVKTETVEQSAEKEQTELELFTAVDNSFYIRLIEEMNAVRDYNGYKGLVLNPELSKIAQLRAEDMYRNNSFVSDTPTYGNAYNMLKNNNMLLRNQKCGENISTGVQNPADIISSLMETSTGRANILNGAYQQVGIGYVEEGNILVQIFITNN